MQGNYNGRKSSVNNTTIQSSKSYLRKGFIFLAFSYWRAEYNQRGCSKSLENLWETHKQKQTALDWRKIVLTQNLRLNVTAGAIQFHIFLSVSFFAYQIPKMSFIQDFTEKLTVRSSHMSIILSVDAKGIVILYFMVKLLWLNRTLTGDPLP